MGKDKGKCGKVLKVQDDGCVVVFGINMIKKYIKLNLMLGISGGIVEKEVFIQVFNVVIFNLQIGKVDCVGFQIKEDGVKVWIFKFMNEVVDNQ